MARPTKYSDKLSDKICERLACGESMRSISRDKDMPSMTTLFKWLRLHEEFNEQYVKAKEESAECDFEKIQQIADDVLSGEVEPQQARVAIDTYKWTAGKKRPKKYGDKIMKELTGADGGPMEIKTHEAWLDMLSRG